MEEIKDTGNKEEVQTYLKRERIRIGERIKSIRDRTGIDAKTLAEKANIDKGNLCKIEKGKYSVGLDTLNKLATGLDMKLDFVDRKQQLEQNLRFKKKFTEEATQQYVFEMHKLAKELDFHRDDTFLTTYAVNHIMYKLGTLCSENGRLGYEFLIEYNITKPTVGIYYGCKGLIYDGNDDLGIKQLDDEWNALASNLRKVLNNTFPGKNFRYKIKPTDNANDHTYWPFWIKLNEDEDIINVASRATKIIRKVYMDVLELHEKTGSCDSMNEIKVRTAFTQEAYNESITKLKKSANPKKNDSEYIVTTLFEQFIKNATNQKILCRDCQYEKAWIIAEEKLNELNFAFLVAAFFDYLKEKEYINTARGENYWQCFTNIILSNKGDYIGANLAKEYSKALDLGPKEFGDLQKDAIFLLKRIIPLESPK